MTAMTLTTLNKKAVASFSQSHMQYYGARPSATGGRQPARWVATDYDANDRHQLFSDRQKGAQLDAQPFDKDQADLIGLVVTIEESPQVTVTLRSWGNVKATFRATCSAGGVMHGSTPDVDYLLVLETFNLK